MSVQTWSAGSVMGCPVLSVVMMLALAGPSFGDKVYLLENYSEEQGGAMLEGSITVSDSATNNGSLSGDEILSWWFTVSDNNETMTHTSDEGYEPSPWEPPFGSSPAYGTVFITESQITLAALTDMIESNSLTLGTSTAMVVWHRTDANYPEFDSGFKALDQSTDHEYWNWRATEYAPLGGNDPWVIATRIPEPDTVALISLGAVALIGLRRRFPERRGTSARAVVITTFLHRFPLFLVIFPKKFGLGFTRKHIRCFALRFESATGCIVSQPSPLTPAL